MSKETDIELETYKDTATTLLMSLMNACGVETDDEQLTIELISVTLQKEVESETQHLQKEKKDLRESLEAFCKVCDKFNVEFMVPEYEQAMTLLNKSNKNLNHTNNGNIKN